MNNDITSKPEGKPAWSDPASSRRECIDGHLWTRHSCHMDFADGESQTLTEYMWDGVRSEVSVCIDTPTDDVPISHATEHAAMLALFEDMWRNDRPCSPTPLQINALASGIRKLAAAMAKPDHAPAMPTTPQKRDWHDVTPADLYAPVARMLRTRFRTPDRMPPAWPHGYQTGHCKGSVVLYHSSAPMMSLDFDMSLYYERNVSGSPTGLLLSPSLALATTELDEKIATPQLLDRMADHCDQLASWLRACAATADALAAMFPDVPMDKGAGA